MGLFDNGKGGEVANHNNNMQARHSRNAARSSRNASSWGNTNSDFLTSNNTEFSRANYGRTNVKRSRKSRKGLKVFLTCLIILLVAVGVCAGVFGSQLYQSAMHVRTQANEAMDDLNDIKKSIVSGDSEKAQQTAKELSQKAKAMNEETDGNLWVLAEKVPVYGDDIKTVRVLTDVFEDVSVNAIEPLCDEMSGISLKSLIGDNNTINVGQVTQLVNTMATVAPVLQRSADAFNQCPEPHLEQLKGIIGKASTQLNSANDLVSSAQQFAPLVSNVFGANGTRHYLVVAQNNVEARRAGGFYGSAGMVTVDNGAISFGDFSTLSRSPYDNAYIEYGLKDTYDRIDFISFPSENLYNLGENPDVPHVAEVFYDACRLADTPIEGVVFVDPIFVQIMVGLTGGFTASDGTWLDGSNAATVIMHDTYWTHFNDGAAQDAFFTMVASDAASHVFSSLGNIDMKRFVETVGDAAGKRHICVWFANSDEQDAIDALGLSGAISSDPTEAVTGVYFTNYSWSKMEWYLRASTEVLSTSRNEDGSTSYEVALHVSNAISDEEASSGNWYVVGGNGHGNKIMYQPGDMLESVLLLAPAGGQIESVLTDGDVFNEDTGSLYGNSAVRKDIHLLPGETVTFTYKVVTSPEAKGDLKFDMTPLAQDAQ